MLFRVWCKNNNEWERGEVILTADGAQFEELYCGGRIMLREDTHIVEFNTGFKFVDGRESFFGDIVRCTDSNYGYGGEHDKIYDGYRYMVLTKELFISEFNFLVPNYESVLSSDIEYVGNIHETQLTDAMKLWL